MVVLSNPPAERAVLAGICRNGNESYLDVSDLIQSTTFTIDANQYIYRCLQHAFSKEQSGIIDIPTIYSAARELGFESLFQKQVNAQHLKAIFDFPVNQKNVRMFAAKIRKLEVARLLHSQLEDAQDKILGLSGEETVTHILGIAENSIFDFSSLLNENEDEPTLIGKGLMDYVKYLGENPVDQIGISTGFPNYDMAIGGGLRPGTVNVIAARPKTGKTLLSDNMGYAIAKTGIPVLNLDTEMLITDHQHRLLACLTECYIYDIETGQFVEKHGQKDKLYEAARHLEENKVPYYHKSIAGMAFEEQLALIRRWIVRHVGLTDNGKAKPCVIIYDYLKLMTTEGLSNDMKEFQLLGFMMTSLHNFAVKYGVPLLTFMQLNRDGIQKESTDTAAGSDRIIWLCSNFSIFKKKSPEEIAEDGIDTGNRKLITVVARHGSGLEEGDYINCHMKGHCAKIVEGHSKLSNLNKKKSNDEGFIIEGNTEEDIPFE